MYTKQFVDSGSGLLRLSRELPLVITAFTGGGLQSGSWTCVLEEDGRVLYLLDKEASFVVVKYMYIQECM